MNVWYVSYGSNICEDRFLCYVVGGTPAGSEKEELGCTDPTVPKRSGKASLPYPLFFAGKRSKWGKGGVAFIGSRPDELDRTIARKYLITEEQFSEVVAQENNKPGLKVNLRQVIQHGQKSITDGPYGNILYLGTEEGYPMFTFTTNIPEDEGTFCAPPAVYLAMIARGLRELGLSDGEIVTYLHSKKGVAGYLTKSQIIEVICPGC